MARVVVCMVVFTGLCAAAVAPAATKVARDTKAGLTFRIEGHTLSVSVTDPAAKRAPRAVRGRLITAVCGTRLRRGRGTRTYKERRWPATRTSLQFWLRRDVSNRARWCVLEQADGDDVAGAYFKRR